MKRVASLFVFFSLPFVVKAGICDTVKVYFKTGEHILTGDAKAYLAEQVRQKILQHGARLRITGYADNVGGEAENLDLSQRRAEAVAAFFISEGWKKSDIQLVEGRGEVKDSLVRNNGENAANRRVDIVQYEETARTSLPENIFFVAGTDTIKPGEKNKLDAWLKAMQDNPCMIVSLEGHTCCTEHEVLIRRPDLNLTDYSSNSISRTVVVEKYLLKHGISRDRLQFNPKGTGSPLHPKPKTPEEHVMNCRVVVRVVK